MSMQLNLDDLQLPIVHAAFIYATDNPSLDPIILQDSECATFNKFLAKSKGKDLASIAKTHSLKRLRHKDSFEINDETYDLYLLHASSDEKAVFVVQGDTLFTKSLNLDEEQENSVIALPFLDGALLRFLERSEIYGTKKPKKKKKKNMHKTKETFSLEEVFRHLDIDGNGTIDSEEWKHGLSTMMGSNNNINDDDMELVFKAISNDSKEISFSDFYKFFDVKKEKKRHLSSLSAQLKIPSLQTLQEDQSVQEPSDQKMDINESESAHIQKVKQRMRECLNLGHDSFVLSNGSEFDGGMLSLPGTPVATSSSSTNSSSDMPAQEVDVSESLIRLERAEELLDLMESNLYQCPDTVTMTKWDNRYQSHKLRVNNFRKILNGMLSSKIVSMKDENTTLLKQLESIRDNGYDNNTSLQDMADLHSQNLSSLTKTTSKKTLKKGKHGRTQSALSRGSRRKQRRNSIDSDDTSSVDSEVNLVYTKGTRLTSKESETLINRVKLQKQELKKQKKEIKKLKENHKLEMVKSKATIDQQQNKLKLYERQRQSIMQTQNNIKDQIRQTKKRQKSKMNLQLGKNESAASQREMTVLKKQLRNLTNELEAEQERKRNLQRKLQRVLGNMNKGDNKSGGNNTVSMNKLKRLEKEKDRLEQECLAKKNKMDEMFLRQKEKDRKFNALDQENSDLRAKLGSYTTQIKEINKRTMELQNITDDRDRCLVDIESLNKKLIKLNERIAKLKNINRKRKERIKNLLLTIEEYDKLSKHNRELINDLTAMQRELNMAEIEASKHKDDNDALNAKIAELQKQIKAKKSELDNNTMKLQKFQDDLSTEYSIIQNMQREIEEKENALNELENAHNEEKNKNMSEQERLESDLEDKSMQLIRSQAQIEQSEKVINRYKDKCAKYEKQIEELNENLINYEQNEAMKLKAEMSGLREEVAAKDDEIALLKKKNEELLHELNQSKDDSASIKEKNDEIDDLMNKIEALQTKLSGKDEKYKNKCNEYDELLTKYKKLEKEMEAKQSRIGKLNIQIKQYQTAKMEHDDDTKLKLKQYNVQIVKIEENKKLIELLRKQVGEFKTKYQIEQEALVRHKKATKELELEAEENEKMVKKLDKKCKKLQKELDTSGFGDSKQKANIGLLRKNVNTLESNLRTKEFEIKKLKNNLKAMGVSATSSEDMKKLKSLNEALQEEVERFKKSVSSVEGDLAANKELLTSKNEEISKLNVEISELKEKQLQIEEERKENEDLSKKLSENKNEKNQQVEKLNDKILDLENALAKMEKEKQRKIDKLEVELAEKDTALAKISEQVGTEMS